MQPFAVSSSRSVYVGVGFDDALQRALEIHRHEYHHRRRLRRGNAITTTLIEDHMTHDFKHHMDREVRIRILY